MLTYILPLISIFIVGLAKSIADTIRVPERFNSSIFKVYKGNDFVDPQVSYKYGEMLPWWAYPFLIHFSDLWHMLNSLIISLFFVAMFNFHFLDIMQNPGLGYFLHFCAYWIVYGLGMETGLKIWFKK